MPKKDPSESREAHRAAVLQARCIDPARALQAPEKPRSLPTLKTLPGKPPKLTTGRAPESALSNRHIPHPCSDRLKDTGDTSPRRISS